MPNFRNELEYFNRTYTSKNDNSEHKRLKKFLTALLNFNSIEDLKEYYYIKSNELNIKFPRLEDKIKKENSLDDIKFKVATCAVNLLHTFK